VSRIVWIQAALESARPPTRMDSATSSTSAVRTASQSGNFSFNDANALMDVLSVVFWDRIVLTSESKTDDCDRARRHGVVRWDGTA